ncbi:MAG: hypothetical protein KC636_19310, partial [Myxococcales bacterium]|nr:hypothetical protein [Myxococcales bacterium]
AKGIDLETIKPEWTRWNAFSQVSVFPDYGFRGWGLSPKFRGRLPAQKTMVIDMHALAALTAWDGDLDRLGHAWYDLSAFVYRVRPRAGQVCVIGAGGGRDVLAALASRAARVWAVEVNPLIVDGVVRGAYREFTGGLYDRDDVTPVIADGRGFLRHTDETFDVIHLSMVDTSAATAAGAHALTENGLYTREAVTEMLARLRPGGVLSMASVSPPGLAVGARLAALARAGLTARGEVDVAGAVLVLRADTLYDLLIKPGGFTAAERERARVQAEGLGFEVVHALGAPPPRDREAGWIATILGEPDPARLLTTQRSWPLDTTAPDDDRPFFFYQSRLAAAGADETSAHLLGGGLGILLRLAAVAAIMVLTLLLAPLVVARVQRGRRIAPAPALAFVTALGLGFMFLEIGLLQRLGLYLAHPTATLAAVLAVLLLCGGLGSRLFAGTGARIDALTRALLGVLGYLGLVVFTGLFDQVIAASWGLGVPARVLVAFALVAPLALPLGAALPAALARVAVREPGAIPWLWAVNSGASVLGAVAATIVAIHGGARACLIVGAGCYALALVLARFVGRGRP